MTVSKLTLPYDVDTVRADFPILQQPHHDGVPLVFIDSAASSQKPNLVIDGMANYYRTTHANVHRGVYQLSEKATETLVANSQVLLNPVIT